MDEEDAILNDYHYEPLGFGLGTGGAFAAVGGWNGREEPHEPAYDDEDDEMLDDETLYGPSVLFFGNQS